MMPSPQVRQVEGGYLPWPPEPGRGGDPRLGERGEVPVLDGSIVQARFRGVAGPARASSPRACQWRPALPASADGWPGPSCRRRWAGAPIPLPADLVVFTVGERDAAGTTAVRQVV